MAVIVEAGGEQGTNLDSLLHRRDTENTETRQRKIASAQSPRSLRLGGELVIQMRSLDSPLSLSAFSLPHKEFILRWLCFAFNGQGRDGIVRRFLRQTGEADAVSILLELDLLASG